MKKIFKILVNSCKFLHFPIFKVLPKCLSVEFHHNFKKLHWPRFKKYKVPPAGCFREEIENVKIWFSSHNFMTDVGAPPIPKKHSPGT